MMVKTFYQIWVEIIPVNEFSVVASSSSDVLTPKPSGI